MIDFDFAYYKPSTVNEAANLFHDLRSDHKKVCYYGGGTEFISRARRNDMQADAVIDLKAIPECNTFKLVENQIIIGGAVTLTDIAEATFFPLLSNVIRHIATRTERNKITIGGNIAGHLFYREAILPFLLADSEIVIAGKDSIRKTKVNGAQLKKGEFIVQIITESIFSQFPHSNSKRTKHSKVNYPIVSVASLHVDDNTRVAFSGVCEFPFRREGIENELNDTSKSRETRIQNAMNYLPAPILDDMHATQDYRKFALERALMEVLEKAEGVSS